MENDPRAGNNNNDIKDSAADAVLFEVTGPVIQGKRKAAALGWPTANVACPQGIPSGIFAGEALWRGDRYPAALYKEDGRDILEAHFLDFAGDLYGQTVIIRARHKVRDVQRFSDGKDLVAAIANDIATIKKLCSQE